MTRTNFIALLLFCAWLHPAIGQSIPALSFEIKKPQKLENKKLGSERNADKKFTFLRRTAQNTFTHFNWEFNANEKLNEILSRAKEFHKDDYTQLLSFYNYSLSVTARDSIELDSVIYKANAGILLHDLRNDWVDNLYMLMGKAYYYRQTLDTAYLTFQYINYAFSPKEKDGYDKVIGSNSNEGGNAFSISTNEKRSFVKRVFTEPPSRNESFLWLIKTYITNQEYPEAAGIIETLKHDPVFPERLQPELHEMQAYWFYSQEMYDSAAHYLEQALPAASNKEERARWEYLIGQLYEASKSPTKAQEFYQLSVKHTLNPIMEVYARLNSIRQNRADEKAIQENIDELVKMARKDRYTDYRDIIYYSAAQIELERNNKEGAKAFLLKSVKSSIDKSADPNQKSRSFLLLGDLAYNDADYRNAKNFYDSVQNKDVVADPTLFDQRKKALTSIAENSDIIYRQDSLQRIAAMPEAEREDYVKKLVKKLRKQQGLKEDEPTPGNNPLNPNATSAPELFDNSAKGDWYFYNGNLKSKGYSEFKGKWGNRPNVDNWRRASAVDKAIQQKQASGGGNDGSKIKVGQSEEGVISFDGLMSKLPLTPEKIKLSNDSSEIAQIELGKALMEGLEDYPAAIKELEIFIDKYLYSSRQPEALMYLYYCYQKTGAEAKAAAIKKLLQDRYKGTDQEKSISNPPTAKEPDPKQAAMDNSYNKIYSLFIEGKFNEALREKKMADSLYSKNYWTPQLLYIQSIYYIKEKQDDSAKFVLQDIINLFPSTTMANKAQVMLDVVNRRKEIEDYLTKLQIERPVEDSLTIEPTAKVSNPTPGKPVTTTVNPGKDTASVAVNKPVVDNKKLPTPVIQKKDSVQPKTPVITSPKGFVNDPASLHFVIIITDKVDGVFVNEAKNAFNRYNKANFYNKQIDIASEIIDDNFRVIFMSGFENLDATMTYLEKVKKIAAAEIVPWLPVAKYSFGVITPANLDILKSTKDIPAYRKFLADAFPGKF